METKIALQDILSVSKVYVDVFALTCNDQFVTHVIGGCQG